MLYMLIVESGIESMADDKRDVTHDGLAGFPPGIIATL